jgi:hypothetical protein
MTEELGLGSSDIKTESDTKISVKKLFIAVLAKTIILGWMIAKLTPSLIKFNNYMNSKQKRKEKRRRIKNALFSIGDVVRIHHKYDDNHYINTFKSRVVTGVLWDGRFKDLRYELDNDNIMYSESYLVPDIKEEKRNIF